MKSICMFLNSEGLPSSPSEEGTIRVYVQNPDTNSWDVKEEFEFSLLKSTSISEIRKTILNMIQRIGDCRVFAARAVTGQLYSVLEINKFNIYEVEGKPEQFLDSILASEIKENENSIKKNTQPFISYPEKTDIEGSYFINLKAALNSDPNLTSKKILLSFIRSKNFKTLEVICDHIPKWFHEEFENLGLQSAVSKVNGNEVKVTISIK
jgi:Fe-only nitrogenase accessory protein AnfO